LATEAGTNGNDELLCHTIELGERALALFRQFTREQIAATELQTGLRQLDTASIMSRHWDVLTREPECVPCLEVLQLLTSLAGEMEHQVERYGESSLWDDLDELQGAVRRVKKLASDRPDH